MFCMWLVRRSIVNLLSLLTLERHGYMCQYHTNSAWIVECPDGTILKFKHNKGLCKGFLFIIMENLSKHVFKPLHVAKNPINASKTGEMFLENLGSKAKALKEFPKRKAYTFLQTVHQNIEGFTKHKVKGANLA